MPKAEPEQIAALETQLGQAQDEVTLLQEALQAADALEKNKKQA